MQFNIVLVQAINVVTDVVVDSLHQQLFLTQYLQKVHFVQKCRLNMEHCLPFQRNFKIWTIAEDQHAGFLPHLNRQPNMPIRPSYRNLPINFFLLNIALDSIIILQPIDIFINDHIPRPLQLIRFTNYMMIGESTFNFINNLILQCHFRLLRWIINEAKLNLQILLKIIFLIKIKSILVLKSGEFLLLLDYQILNLLQSGIVEPKRTGQVVVT